MIHATLRWSAALALSMLLVAPGGVLTAQTPDPQAVEFFEQKIRPVLVQQCYSCHSAEARDAKKLKGSLLVDSAAGLLVGGDSGPALVAGNPAESLLIKALKYDGVEMPPSGKLSDEVIADFVKWVELGAPDPRSGEPVAKPARVVDVEAGRQFWSFQPLAAVTPPDVPRAEWSTTAIDRFVAAKHIEHGLEPNGPASREKLLRRVYFDLIGLPPTPEQMTAFLNDTSATAFETVVDQLLASDRYGERWARHWLDVARFAESGGYEFDGFRSGAFHYRDWVIRALNNDLPYNEFVRQQLAGDKLATDDYLASAATGFLVAGPYPGQITAKTVERIRYDQLDDMIMTIGGSMLGLTLGCVRCHDHKYDPIRQQDYYAIAADLGRTSHGSRYVDPDPQATAARVAEHAAQHESIKAAIREFANAELPAKFEAWRVAELPKQPDAPHWQILEPVSFHAERQWLKRSPGGFVIHDGGHVPGTVLTRQGERRPVRSEDVQRLVYRTHQQNIQSVRFDALTDKVLPSRGPGLNGDGSFQLVELTITAQPLVPVEGQSPIPLKLKPVFAAFSDPNQPLDHAVDGKPETAWVIQANARRDNAAVFELEAPLAGFPGGTELVWEFKFRDFGLGRLRCAISTEPNPATWAGESAPQHLGEIRAILAANGNTLPESLRPEMVRWLAPFDAATQQVLDRDHAHVAASPRAPLHEVYTTVDGGQDVYLLRRGEVDNKQGKADPGIIEVLWRGAGAAGADATASPVAAATADPRIRLADWITDVDHGAGALLARVMVNRLWQHHFGEGIVTTPNDFGAQGDRPTHPELLEYLANELVRGGWRLKSLHKQIVLTQAYQQSAEIRPENVQRDPANRWLWHHRSRRLEGETIRDAVLAAGGSLDLSLYGQSVLDDSMRRSVYLRVKRSELSPFMTMFDVPEPTQSLGKRISTTVPTQALTLMNSPIVRQQAEKLATRIRPTADVPLDNAVEQAYRIAFARLPTESERQRMIAFIEQQAAGQPDQQLALAEFCHVLMCLNEFVYID